MDATITSFQAAHPHITLLTPSSPDFAARRKRHANLPPMDIMPPGILVPKSAADVSAIVRWAGSSSPPVKFAFLGGGADFWGRSFEDDALVLDLRELNSVRVSSDRKTATIGGGIIAEKLMRTLEADGLITPTGNWWNIGYAGWATLGGYGPLTSAYGMGYEQIVGARVVDASGNEVAADEEMLEGIRGMGGNLGVITELTIKVYPAHDLLSGMLIYDSATGLGDTMRRVQTGLSTLTYPKVATTHTFVQSLPPPISTRVIAVLFTWGGADHAAGRAFLEEVIAATGGVKMNMVAAVSLVGQQQNMPHVTLPRGGQRSAYVREMTPAVIDLAVRAADSIPSEPSPNLSLSENVPIDPATTPANTFAPGGGHCLVTYSYFCADESRREEVMKWNLSVDDMVRACEDVLPGAYPGLTPSDGRRDGEGIFGAKWERAKALKLKYDPKGIFALAVPRMGL